MKQIDYATAPLRFSDHRPVYATFDCKISNIDEHRKEEISRALYEKRKQDINSSTTNDEKTEEDLVGYNPVAAGLPPASSDRRKWWLDNGIRKLIKCLRILVMTDRHRRSPCPLSGTTTTKQHDTKSSPTFEPFHCDERTRLGHGRSVTGS